MNKDQFGELGKRLLAGELSLDRFQTELSENWERYSGRIATEEAHVDLDRARRCGYPEVIYGEGKTQEAIRDIIRLQSEQGIDCFATRVSPEKAEFILKAFPGGVYNPIARTFRLPKDLQRQEHHGKVAVLTAGTSDRPVAEEAAETARWMGAEVVLIQDVGVAGPERLRARYDDFKDADALVVCAGMEGALPSVVGGYVRVPVIAVPTSVGYGAAFGGVAALLGMLNSCASNVLVVNIDAGFKGGYTAGIIAARSVGKKESLYTANI